MVTQEDLFLYNIQQIISNILKDYQREIQDHDIISWMQKNPEIVGEYFTNYIINYGLDESDLL